MTLKILRSFLGWCTMINMGLLLVWFVSFALAHDRIFRFHGRWFKLPLEEFDAIHYAGMGRFKIGIFLLNLAPYLALRIVDPEGKNSR